VRDGAGKIRTSTDAASAFQDKVDGRYAVVGYLLKSTLQQGGPQPLRAALDLDRGRHHLVRRAGDAALAAGGDQLQPHRRHADRERAAADLRS
jgi:hypothetical protein